VLVTQLGCDTHATDPLAHLSLTTAAYRSAYRVLHEMGHTAADGRWLATGGGGYQWAHVVPRAWTLAFAEMAGIPVDDELPAEWVALASRQAGEAVPATFADAPVPSNIGREQVQPTVEQVRDAIFPLHGIGM
jgi:acetoin utilization protein AcuC